MRKPIAFAALCACMALMSGCLATEQHIDNMQDQLNELSASLSAMNKKQAELNAKLDTVSNSLSAHAETLRDFDDQMSKLSAKMDDVQSGITEATGDMMMFQLMKLPENSVGYGLEQWGRLILMDTLLLQTELLFGNAEG